MQQKAKADTGGLELRLANSEHDLRAAQRLRYNVFVGEMGSDGAMVDHEQRLECDEFDPLCDHLLLIDRDRDAEKLEHVVGVYRLLPGERLPPGQDFYSGQEFDLAPLKNSGRKLLELGRSCVHPDWRRGLAMRMLWDGLAEYVLDRGIELMFGTASFHGTDPARVAAPLAYLARNHLAPSDLRPEARPPYRVELDPDPDSEIDRRAVTELMPILMKGYLRLGGFVGNGAWIDEAFNTIDVLLIMDTANMSTRHRDYYARRHHDGD